MSEVMIREYADNEEEALGKTIAKANLAGYPHYVRTQTHYTTQQSTNIAGVYKIIHTVEVIYSDDESQKAS